MQQITKGRMKLAEHSRKYYVAVAPHGVSMAQALDPAFWAHVAQYADAWDRIELRAEDDSWFADMIVVKATRTELHMKVLTSFELSASAPAGKKIEGVPVGYEVNYGGPIHKHRVIRSADSELLAHGLSKDEAIAWAKEHANAAA